MIILKRRMPSLTERRLEFQHRAGFILTNGSVASYSGRLFVVVNAIDQFLDVDGFFRPLDPGGNTRKAATNLTYLARLNDDLSVGFATELSIPVPPDLPWEWRGLECPRLFAWGGGLWLTGCSHATGDAPEAKLFIGRIQGEGVAELHELVGPERVEKNWMPEVFDGGDNLRFHYRLGVLIAPDNSPPWHPGGRRDLSDLHGGTQVIPWDAGSTCIVHSYRRVEGSYRKDSRQHFVRLDRNGCALGLSPPVTFARAPLEIATGLAYHPDGQRMVVSYGRSDADPDHPYQENAFLGTFALNELGRVI